MPPKNRKQKERVQSERFQAVVLTDSYETRFMPLTAIEPRCLLPLADIPLIEYTLEFLANTGVNEVYLVCSSHADKIQQYIDKSKWSSARSPFKIKTIMSLESRSVGDAMRDIDNRGLIAGDFLLVSGDVVTNIDFEKAMAVHKRNKAMDNNHILTMVLAPASPFQKTRSPVSPATFTLDKKTARCIYYQGIPPADGKKSCVNIDPEFLEDVDEMLIRNDLIDCHIDICTPHIPQIFQENFDYQYLRDDFVKGVLTSDLLKKTIYAYITDGIEYAARVESWATYDAVSQDILARYCYPLVPDANLIDSSYRYEFNNIYKEDKILLAQSCKIGNNTSIGRGSSIDEGTIIEKSVIGRNCFIGKNVRIKNSYIWDNAIVKDNAHLNHNIVASNTVIGNSVDLGSGSVIGFNVIIEDNKVIPRNTRIVDTPRNKTDNSNENSSFDDSAEEEEGSYDEDSGLHRKSNLKSSELVGEKGQGCVYISEDDWQDDSDSEIVPRRHDMVLYQLGNLNISDDSIISLTNNRKKHRHHSRSRRLSSTSAVSADLDEGLSDGEEDFAIEAIATVDRAMENNHDLDTAVLELNTLRMSINVTYHDLRLATAKALLYKIIDFITTGTLGVKEATEKVFNKWGLLFKRQVFDDAEQVDLLHIIQEICSQFDHAYNERILFMTVTILYNQDIIEEDNIYVWWDAPESSSTEPMKQVRGLTGKWVEWLKQAEEESDEDDEE